MDKTAYEQQDRRSDPEHRDFFDTLLKVLKERIREDILIYRTILKYSKRYNTDT